jgi:hypothetical protein
MVEAEEAAIRKIGHSKARYKISASLLRSSVVLFTVRFESSTGFIQNRIFFGKAKTGQILSCGIMVK